MSWLFLPLVIAIGVIEFNLLPSSSWATLALDVVIFSATWRYGHILIQSLRDLFSPSRYDNAEAILQTNKEKAWESISVIISLFGISGLALWYGRWLSGWSIGSDLQQIYQLRNYLDLSFLCALLLEFMKLKIVKSYWKRVELTPPRIGLLFYLAISCLGAYFLLLPWSLKEGSELSVINSFFVSVSAITVTGLSPVNPAETFSLLGLGFLIIVIQIGGMGIAFFSAMIASFARQRLSLTQSKIGQELYSVPDLGNVAKFLVKIFTFTLGAELLGALLIYTGLPHDLPDRAFHAIFHSVSAFCNAGFSSLPQGLEVPGLAFMKTVVCFLIIFGGIGFPVVFELMGRIRFSRKKGLPLSSETYLVLLVTTLLLIGGAIGISLTELVSKGGASFSIETLGHSFFNSVTSRTAGFSSVSISSLSLGSQFLILILMIIGASPVSTGGGLKTTTVALLVISVWNFFRGNKWLQFHRREIPYYVLHKCVAIVFCYIILLVFSVGFLVAVENIDLWRATFESASALSTVGLSLGVTSELSSLSKLMFSFLMIAGRYGLVTLVFAGIGRLHEQRYRYPTGKFFVG